MLYLTLIIILLSLAAYAWLNQTIKQALVEPVIKGQLPIKLLSEKRRWQVLWEEWKFITGIALGLIAGWWL